MNCLSVNVQGAGSLQKRTWVRKLCIFHKINFLAIQETKMEDVDLATVRSFWGNSSFMCVVSPSEVLRVAS